MHLTGSPFLLLITVASLFSSSGRAWSTTITLEWRHPHAPDRSELSLATAYCTAVPPGRCCASLPGFGATLGTFRALPDAAIGAFWQSPGPGDFSWTRQTACSGRVLDAHVGGPLWIYQAPESVKIAGASYIQCPSRMAATGRDTGIGWLGVLLGFCTSGSRKRSAAPGAIIKPTWTYPDIVQVNGTNYTNGMAGLIYKDWRGRRLDLKSLRLHT